MRLLLTMMKIRSTCLSTAVYIAKRIFYYKRVLKARPAAEIIGRIQEMKGSALPAKHSGITLLDKTHFICHNIQRVLLRDDHPCLVRALVLYEICVR